MLLFLSVSLSVSLQIAHSKLNHNDKKVNNMKRLALIGATLSCCLLGNSAIAQQTPPETWQEHWFEHNQVVERVYYDDDVAIYYDDDVDPSITWMYQFVGDVWRYTKQTYGDFGGKPRLYAIFHSDKYGGGHPSTWWDAHHDYRNVIDIGKAGDWYSMAGWNINVIAHEISHIVELGSFQTHGSPAFGLWKDSKWAEIFNYDVFFNLNMSAAAQAVYNDYSNNVDNFPRANTYWFRDWFYPIYDQYGGNQVLRRYFELLSQHFPKNGNEYARAMNWGEFVHFWSGAADTDLKAMATSAFGWSTEWEAQYTQAKIDFPFTTPPTTEGVTLYEHCGFDGYSATLAEGSYTLAQLNALGVANDEVSSISVPEGYQIEVFQDDPFQGTALTFDANASCLEDNGFNDKISSVVVTKLVTEVATFYEHCNFDGYAVALEPGDYTLSDLMTLGFGNDDISSLSVMAGYQVDLYQNDNFSGNVLTVTADDSCLVDDGFNYDVSSLVITKQNCGLAVWSSNKIYTGGMEVEYNGVQYRAKWWTQGEIPSQSAVWENIGACGG